MILSTHSPASPTASPLLEIRNASVFRGRAQALENLHLTIDHGQHTVILGPNGAGKTTLLKLLARELYPVAEPDLLLRLFGREQWDIWTLRSRLGIVSQDLQIGYPGKADGLEVVLSGLRSTIGTYAYQQFSQAEQNQALRILTGIAGADLADKPFQSLSTGQQRRLLLARALVHEPEALLLDEPTSGLDIAACFQYLATVRDLMRQGKTIILVTHHIHEIPPEICRVVLLRGGKIMADGPKQAVLTEKALTDLFAVPLRLLESGGFFQVVPA
ncbi:ABC transporter ATP-binding protein [Desulfonatronum thioautotrophicum]|uniref:ABC transporter ATP-binding protein n=1 Tax=Desulfonatronum thioautotrophicum TaxID=617001 RepID=UPI0005EB795E|nr:ATP-binding cassette domain-containing protein [Desulfonatronum thioautotrophicum]